jgi:hypothetical protein
MNDIFAAGIYPSHEGNQIKKGEGGMEASRHQPYLFSFASALMRSQYTCIAVAAASMTQVQLEIMVQS